MSTAARAHLECTGGPEKGQTLRVAPSATVLGRDASCDVVLSETVISRQHARIDRRADQWLLTNLSSNGTLVNKKSVTEVVLTDGDEIRLGAKTRLKFIIESVVLSGTGRPQFRRRTGAPSEAEAAAAEAEKAEAEEAPVSVFRRRKFLFVGLAVYLAAMLAFMIVSLFWSPGQTAKTAIPDLALDDTVILPGTSQPPMRVIAIEPNGGVRCENRLGDIILVPHEDFAAGKAVGVRGIRSALDVKYLVKKDAPPDYHYTIDDTNSVMGDRCVKKAIEEYRVHKVPGHEPALFGAVRLFQKALAYYGGRGYFEKPAEEQAYQAALKELVGDQENPGTILRDYKEALFLDRAGQAKQAKVIYDRILKSLPDMDNLDNPICVNVKRRITDLVKRNPDMK
jgi:pSer/pThr/pTyr-binding forkhead associated (FHA) protein